VIISWGKNQISPKIHCWPTWKKSFRRPWLRTFWKVGKECKRNNFSIW